MAANPTSCESSQDSSDVKSCRCRALLNTHLHGATLCGMTTDPMHTSTCCQNRELAKAIFAVGG